MVPMHGRTAEGAFHEPQSAARILPADPSEQSTAGKMPAAPWRCRLIRFRFMVPMPAQKRKAAFHELQRHEASWQGRRSAAPEARALPGPL